MNVDYKITAKLRGQMRVEKVRRGLMRRPTVVVTDIDGKVLYDGPVGKWFVITLIGESEGAS